MFKEWLGRVSYLTEEDCALFEPHLRVRHIPAKAWFLNEGRTCEEIGFVNYGGFRTYYLADGKEINTQFVFEHEFVADYDSFLQHKPARYSIQALENSEVVCFNLEALQQAYGQSQRWERFGRMMAEQAYTLTMRRVESFMFLDGEQRYRELLTRQPHLLDRVALYHLASYLGLERESLSRLRRKVAGKR